MKYSTSARSWRRLNTSRGRRAGYTCEVSDQFQLVKGFFPDEIFQFQLKKILVHLNIYIALDQNFQRGTKIFSVISEKNGPGPIFSELTLKNSSDSTNGRNR